MIVAGMVISANCAVVLQEAGVVNVVAVHLTRDAIIHRRRGQKGGGSVRNNVVQQQEQTSTTGEGIKRCAPQLWG